MLSRALIIIGLILGDIWADSFNQVLIRRSLSFDNLWCNNRMIITLCRLTNLSILISMIGMKLIVTLVPRQLILNLHLLNCIFDLLHKLNVSIIEITTTDQLMMILLLILLWYIQILTILIWLMLRTDLILNLIDLLDLF